MVENGVTIVCATTDNASNMVATARELAIKHMPCYSHTLQLVVTDLFFPSSKKMQEQAHLDGMDADNVYQYVIYML